MTILRNSKQVKGACGEATLAVVTKGRSVSEMLEIIEAGATIIAENRVQEAKEKFAALEEHAGWQNLEKHLIGHLQTNKVNDAVQLFNVIQSVDSLRIAEAIDEAAEKIKKVQQVLIQVNISKDEDKFGIYPSELKGFYDSLKDFENLQIEGLMTITKNYDDMAETRTDFQKMKVLFDEFCSYAEIRDPVLSMGMSSDYQMAIEEGSNMVRVGTAIFGPRL